jgi:hypothetical protein
VVRVAHVLFLGGFGVVDFSNWLFFAQHTLTSVNGRAIHVEWGRECRCTYEAFDTGGEKGRTLAEFEKMRLELAWRHFDLHAKQRTQMFHFFIILVPFLFGGCFILFKEREIVGSLPPIIASVGGGFLALLFLLLDQRNKQLYPGRMTYWAKSIPG